MQDSKELEVVRLRCHRSVDQHTKTEEWTPIGREGALTRRG